MRGLVLATVLVCMTTSIAYAQEIAIITPVDGAVVTLPFVISGTAPPGQTLYYRFGDGAPLTVRANNDGAFRIDVVSMDEPEVFLGTDPNALTVSRRFVVEGETPDQPDDVAVPVSEPEQEEAAEEITPDRPPWRIDRMYAFFFVDAGFTKFFEVIGGFGFQIPRVYLGADLMWTIGTLNKSGVGFAIRTRIPLGRSRVAFTAAAGPRWVGLQGSDDEAVLAPFFTLGVDGAIIANVLLRIEFFNSYYEDVDVQGLPLGIKGGLMIRF